jgi:hypothetical protein
MTPRSELNQMIIVANNNLKYGHKPVTLRYDHITGSGYRIIAYNDRLDSDIEISPRLSLSNLIIWLDGFIDGLEF